MEDTNFDYDKKFDDSDEKWKLQPWRNWIFTWFNYTDEDYEHLKTINAETCKCIIFGVELTTNGQCHLQGYIELNKAIRFTGLKKILDPINGKKSEVRVRPRSPDATRQDNIIYCSKGLQTKTEYKQYKQNGPNYGKDAIVYKQIFKEEHEGQGKRNDWIDIYNTIKENPDFGHILEKFPDYAMGFPNGIQKAIDTVINQNAKTALTDEMDNLKLFTWETKLLEELKQYPDKRKIIWYVDEIGGSGKSTFAKYLLAKGNCAYFTNAKSTDIAHAYKGERTVIFDFTRSVEGRINYEIIESIKNGVIFSGKYNSGLKVNATPHIICFSNFPPDTSKLSYDRWDCRSLSPSDKIYPEPITIDSNFEDSDNESEEFLESSFGDSRSPDSDLENSSIKLEHSTETLDCSIDRGQGNTRTSSALDLPPIGGNNLNKYQTIYASGELCSLRCAAPSARPPHPGPGLGWSGARPEAERGRISMDILKDI